MNRSELLQLKKALAEDIAECKRQGLTDENTASWGYQEGVLLTVAVARKLLESVDMALTSLKKPVPNKKKSNEK